MKFINVTTVILLVPVFLYVFYRGCSQVSDFYDWYAWYNSGAEAIEIVGKVEKVTLPPRRGAGGHGIYFKTSDGDKIKLRALLNRKEFATISFLNGDRVREGEYTALYTIGMTGRNELFNLSIGGDSMLNEPMKIGGRSSRVFAVIAFCVLWFSISFVIAKQVLNEIKKEKNNV